MISTTFPDELSSYDRPAPKEVARLREATDSTIEALDQPADLLADMLDRQLSDFSGSLPTTKEGLRMFVIQQFRGIATVTAVSAMIDRFVDSEVRGQLADFGRRMLVVIRTQSRPALACDCLAAAFGMHISEGRTMEELASPHGVTKQAFSKRTVRLCRELGVEPSVLMRSEDSRESYRLKQLQKHAVARAAGTGSVNTKTLREKLALCRKHMTGRELRLAAM